MVLQSSGEISIGQLRTEYNASGAFSLRANGSPAEPRVPQSGAVSLSSFYKRYGIPQNNLTVWLDARDSYPGSGNTWNDLKGNANTTLYNSPAYTSPYLAFNGINQYGTIPSSSGITDFTSSQAYTVTCWVWIAATQNDTGNIDNDIIEKWEGPTGYPYVVRYDRANVAVMAATWNGSAGNFISSANNTISTNNWQNITTVFNWPGNALTVYINGVSRGTSTLTGGGNVSNNSPVYLMMRGTNNNKVTGRLFFVAIYSRALSGAEVSQIYNATRGVLGV